MRRRRGLARLEHFLILAILAVIAGIVHPVLRDVRNDADASRILALCAALKDSCEQHFAETGRYATELSDGQSPDAHQLALPQEYPNWDGPYLERPIGPDDNPFGGKLMILPSLASSGGFDPTGRGERTLDGRGQYVRLTHVPQEVATLVDDAIDRNVPGEWMKTGQVEYDPTDTGTLILLLMYEL